jgi:exosortase E/protease (VPEID-CTERM system)
MRTTESLTVATPKLSFGLAGRLALLALVLCAEKVLLDSFVDSVRAQSAGGVGALVRFAQHWGFRFLVTFGAAVLVFAYVRSIEQLRSAEAAFSAEAFRAGWALAHVVGLVALVFLSHSLYRPGATQWEFSAVLGAWLIVGGGSISAALLATASGSLWLSTVRSLGNSWLYALVTALVSVLVWQWSELLWTPMANITFAFVRVVLSPFLPELRADATIRVLATDHFAIRIDDYCSGLEGIAMMLTFVVTWLVCFRRDYIFPQALCLIPAAAFAMFVLNVVRICILMFIGYEGYPEVASYGFHSQAGWIAFNSVACGLAIWSRRIAWLSRMPAAASDSAAPRNPTATYLMPLLSLLVAGVLSHALSGHFETFYPLRLVIGLTVLWVYRRELWAINWSWSWRGVVTGAVVFLIWMLAAHFLLPSAGMPGQLAAMTGTMSLVWIAARLVVPVLIVPIAEELAYRGYLMRCFGGVEFDSLPYRSVSALGLMISSAAFGVVHGSMWLPGLVAGLAYGWVVMRRGSLGEAVMAHATTNALVAVAVLGFGQWQLW